MRIESYNQIQQIYNSSKANKATGKPQTAASDQLQISTMGKDILSAKQAIANSSDIREAVAAPVKASIQAGTYQVSGDSFANKLLEKYSEMR